MAPLKGELARACERLRGRALCTHVAVGESHSCSATFVYPAARDFRLRGDPAPQDDASLLSRCAGWRAYGAPCSFLFFPAEEKKRTKEKKAPTEINLPVLQGVRMLDFKCYRLPWRFPFASNALACHLKSQDASERPCACRAIHAASANL